ncbi:MAG: hypothetical protein ETSY2_44655 [Candidatus Entotheonella gemina]|uniref:Pyridoxamine 5'-phosphate oxidase N-terminal domain-containing protein n=1 Tax=Candidatus Entotheonella gemina TaxID=1429439 RepID=W4LHH1_9BACT|nr:MAG: hypothetical protein ETSY2_44655 [Candidatus Entotheonella gemina]
MKTIQTIEEVRALVGDAPSAAAADKFFPHLSSQAVEFIGRSPFLMLSTHDAAGNVTISPKGDAAGFVYVADQHTLYIPERKGNRLIVSLQNILATGAAGLIFTCPEHERNTADQRAGRDCAGSNVKSTHEQPAPGSCATGVEDYRAGKLFPLCQGVDAQRIVAA